MKRLVNVVFCILLAACAAEGTPASSPEPVPTSTAVPSQAEITSLQWPVPAPSRTPKPVKKPTIPPTSIILPALQPTSTPLPNETPFDVDAWKEAPVIPSVDPSISAIYQYGQTLGNDDWLGRWRHLLSSSLRTKEKQPDYCDSDQTQDQDES